MAQTNPNAPKRHRRKASVATSKAMERTIAALTNQARAGALRAEQDSARAKSTLANVMDYWLEQMTEKDRTAFFTAIVGVSTPAEARRISKHTYWPENLAATTAEEPEVSQSS